jgi:hypothetical protein
MAIGVGQQTLAAEIVLLESAVSLLQHSRTSGAALPHFYSPPPPERLGEARRTTPANEAQLQATALLLE